MAPRDVSSQAVGLSGDSERGGARDEACGAFIASIGLLHGVLHYPSFTINIALRNT